jgi:signal transduction histidine kinase
MRNYRALCAALVLLLAPLLGQAQALLLDPEASHLGTAGYLQRLDDPEGSLDPVHANASQDWRELPGNLNASFTRSTIWLRLEVTATQPGQWVLLLGNALLDEVQIYARTPSGSWRSLGASGENLPRQLWPVDYRRPALQLDLTEPGEHTLLVRLAARNALNTKFEIWQRLAFDNHSRREGLFFGLYYGFYLLLICLHALFWYFTRAPLSGLFLAYIGLCVHNEVLSLGLVQQITGISGPWSDRLLGLGMATVLPVATLLIRDLLVLAPSFPRVARWLVWPSTALCTLCAILILLGQYDLGVVPMQLFTLVLILVVNSLGLWLLHRRHPPAAFFLIAFVPYDAAIFLAYLRNMGVLPVNFVTDHISALGTMLHMVLLSLWLLGRYERQRRTNERQQIQLEAEIAQQQQREGELLQSLELERRVRQEQRDFVAMVSHEFRTPLAVISTSAQQLARNLDAPPDKTLARSQNIRAAVKRLLALVDDCLADDRMAEPLQPPHQTPVDLHALIDGLGQDFAPGRITCDHAMGTRQFATDPALLRIALRNLLANANRHAPEGASVQVTTRHEAGQLRIAVSHPAARIPPEEQPHLFQRYWRGQGAQQQPGAGLGLYLVRRIAEKLGGTVALTSAGGDAPVCFQMNLPAQPQLLHS